MSGRSVPRYALAGLLAAAFAVPAAAQEGGFQVPLNSDPVVPVPLLPEAPMPREKVNLTFEYELSFSDLKVKVQETPTGSCCLGAAKPANTHETGGRPCCCDKPVAVAPMPRDQKQLFNFSLGLFASDEWTMPQTLPAPQIVVPPLGPCPPPVFLMGGSSFERPLPAVRPTVAVAPLACAQPLLMPPAPPVLVQPQMHGANVIQIVAMDVCSACPNPLIGTWYRDLGICVVAVTFTHDEMKLCMTQRDDAKLLTLTATAHYTMTKDGLVFGAVTGADVDIKCDSKSDNKGEMIASMELAELSLMLQELSDAPFSFRMKMTSAGLAVSHVKAASTEGIRGKELAVLGGVYKLAKDGKVPPPIPRKTDTEPQPEPGQKLSYPPAPTPNLLDMPLPPPPLIGVATGRPLLGAAIGGMSGTATGALVGNEADKHPAPTMPEPVQHLGVDFNFNPPQMLLPCERGPGATCPAPAPRPGCNDAMKSMAAESFGQMLWSAGGAIPAGTLLTAPQWTQGTVPAGTPTGSYIVLPAGATPMPVTTATAMKSPHMGTWFRIGAKQCVVKIEADHLTITLSEAQELDGKKMVGHLTFTADYSITRDGMTAVGLLTNVDVKFDGDLPEDDMSGMMEKIRELQKALEEKPFAMTFRRYGETLVIGNVRMPEVGDGMESQPATYVGGRYTNVGDKPLPKLKVTKACEPRPMPMPAYNLPPGVIPGSYPGYSGPSLPPSGPVYGLPVPQGYFPPPPVCSPATPGPGIVFPGGSAYPQASTPPLPPPTGDLLPPQAIPCPVPSTARPVEWVTPTVRPTRPVETHAEPTMPEPVAPAPTMPEPLPPTVSLNKAAKRLPVTEMAFAWRNKVSQLPDPTRNGEPGPCLVGQLFLFSGPKLQFAQADGTLTVDLVDETPRAYGQSGAKPERWQLDKETLHKLFTVDETFGKSYVLTLPWPSYSSDVTRVRISARYDANNGQTLYATPSVVAFPQLEVGSIIRALESQSPPQKQLFNFSFGVFGAQ